MKRYEVKSVDISKFKEYFSMIEASEITEEEQVKSKKDLFYLSSSIDSPYYFIETIRYGDSESFRWFWEQAKILRIDAEVWDILTDQAFSLCGFCSGHAEIFELLWSEAPADKNKALIIDEIMVKAPDFSHSPLDMIACLDWQLKKLMPEDYDICFKQLLVFFTNYPSTTEPRAPSDEQVLIDILNRLWHTATHSSDGSEHAKTFLSERMSVLLEQAIYVMKSESICKWLWDKAQQHLSALQLKKVWLELFTFIEQFDESLRPVFNELWALGYKAGSEHGLIELSDLIWLVEMVPSLPLLRNSTDYHSHFQCLNWFYDTYQAQDLKRALFVLNGRFPLFHAAIASRCPASIQWCWAEAEKLKVLDQYLIKVAHQELSVDALFYQSNPDILKNLFMALETYQLAEQFLNYLTTSKCYRLFDDRPRQQFEHVLALLLDPQQLEVFEYIFDKIKQYNFLNKFIKGLLSFSELDKVVDWNLNAIEHIVLALEPEQKESLKAGLEQKCNRNLSATFQKWKEKTFSDDSQNNRLMALS